MSIGLVIFAVIAYALKVAHDNRACAQEWQRERREFERYIDGLAE